MSKEIARPVYCPNMGGMKMECETPNACAGGVDCRRGAATPETTDEEVRSASGGGGMSSGPVGQTVVFYDATKWTPPPLPWGAATCERCKRPFDYIKQDRMPVPVMCKRCDP